MNKTLTLAGLVVLLLSGCAGLRPTLPAGTICETKRFALEDDFDGARRGACRVDGAGRVTLFNVREDDRVTNPSPWFAFRLVPRQAGLAKIRIDYADWSHRYAPKFSTDGVAWQPLPADTLELRRDGEVLELSIELGDTPLIVAAHELILPAEYQDWSQGIAASGVARLSVAGHSIEGRPILMLDTGEGPGRSLLLTGRQHPPEVSGAVAFFAFAEAVFSDSDLARRFREHFRIVALPLMNPDGVVEGHWRHNLGETDLNRDWGPFAQPETQVVAGLLDALDAAGEPPAMFIDFHSTRENLFYTQSEPTVPAGLSARWLERSADRIEDYAFVNAPRPTSDTANGKNYMYKRYGIPSLTYEVGDETPRDAVRTAATVFAEELMRLWLEELDAAATAMD